MDSFLYSVELPFSGVSLSYREINTNEQLALSKNNVIIPIDDENCIEYSKNIQKIIENCVENKEDFKKITIIDYILFLIKIRTISFGNDLEIFLNQKTKNEEKIKISLDLDILMKNLYDISSELLKDSTFEINDIKIELSWPNIKSESVLLNNTNKNILEHILDTACEYIKIIKIKDNIINFQSFTNQERVKFYERLPLSLRNKIQNKIFEITKKISEKNLFNISRMEDLRFNLYNKTHLEIIKLMFSFDLRSIYQDLYVLANKKMNPSYIGNLSVAERRVFISFIEEEMKERNNTNNSIPVSKNSTELQDLIDEFGG